MTEIEFPEDETCPDCGGFIWRDGPRGGLSQNIECVGCGSRFNVTRMSHRMRLAENVVGVLLGHGHLHDDN